MEKNKLRAARIRRHRRVRLKVRGTGTRPRLSIFRSLNHIYAQVIDDVSGHTLVAASTVDAEVRGETDSKAKSDKAGLVGSVLARRALAEGIKQVAFDRGGYQYHGRVRALAEAARKGGLEF